MNDSTHRLACLSAAILAAAFPAGTEAQTTYAYTSGGTANSWSDSLNWSPAGVPGAGDSIVQSGPVGGDTFVNLGINRSLQDFTWEGTAGACEFRGTNANLDIAGTLTVNVAAAPNLTFRGAGGGLMTLSVGAISMEVGKLLFGQAGGSNALTNLTVTGLTTIAGGTSTGLALNVSGNAAFGAVEFTGTGGERLTLNTASGTGTARTVNVASLAGTDSTTGVGAVNLSSSGSHTATLNITGTAGTTSYAGVIRDNFNVGAGHTLILNKTGGSTQVLTGANTYSGATTVSSGTLAIAGSGSINNSSSVTVSGTGVLDYGSTVALSRDVVVDGGAFVYNSSEAYAGNLTLNSGSVGGSGNLSGTALIIGAGQAITPGNSPGELVTGSETWNAGGRYEFEINDAAGAAGANWDHLTINGTLDLSGLSALDTFELTLVSLDALNAPGLAQNFDGSQSYSWEFASFTSLTGTFSSSMFVVNTSAFQNSFTGAFSVQQDGNALDLVYTAVPEPATGVTMLGAGLFALALRHRRRAAALGPRV